MVEPTFYDKVQEDIYESRQIGVQGVPFFLFNNQYAVSGAQPVKAFEQTLEKSFAAWKSSQPTISVSTIEGKSCTPDEECK
jgi:protein disulfide-isomerase